MAIFAANAQLAKGWVPEQAFGVGNRLRKPRMATDTSVGNGAAEPEIIRFETRRKLPAFRPRIESERRLKNKIAALHHVANTVFSGSHGIGNLLRVPEKLLALLIHRIFTFPKIGPAPKDLKVLIQFGIEDCDGSFQVFQFRALDEAGTWTAPCLYECIPDRSSRGR